ncbi:MAG: Crp/Fnr family transcriptional regulator [Gammaproteobacteria bacterium]|nr:MAG: Crp/Fnr family transcriptional regulator [Gammaproteobacteria bacterium]
MHLFRRLDEQDKQTLMAFAAFLASRAQEKEAAPVEPRIIPRPPKESVVGAIKRLSASYPMLDKAKLLNETSALMAQHVMQGRPAKEVIDELEVMFRRHYERYLEER